MGAIWRRIQHIPEVFYLSDEMMLFINWVGLGRSIKISIGHGKAEMVIKYPNRDAEWLGTQA